MALTSRPRRSSLSHAGRQRSCSTAACAGGSPAHGTVHDAVLFVQHLLNGLLAGAYYLLIALGLSLIFSLGGIVNLAHGAFFAIGAYLAVSIGGSLGFGGALCFADAVGVARRRHRAAAVPPLLQGRSDRCRCC